MSLSVMPLTSTTQQYGADTLRIMTLSIMAQIIMALVTINLSRMILSIVLLSLMVRRHNETHLNNTTH
jgi:hypothetical protein